LHTVDVGFFVAKAPSTYGALPELVDFVAPQQGGEATLHLQLEAGNYMLLPWSSGRLTLPNHPQIYSQRSVLTTTFFTFSLFSLFGLDFWTFGLLVLLDFWTFGVLDFWSFGLLDFWTFGLLDFVTFDVCSWI
jgi:hypothetical protein